MTVPISPTGILEIEMRVGSMLLLREACYMSPGVGEPVIQARSGHPRRMGLGDISQGPG